MFASWRPRRGRGPCFFCPGFGPLGFGHWHWAPGPLPSPSPPRLRATTANSELSFYRYRMQNRKNPAKTPKACRRFTPPSRLLPSPSRLRPPPRQASLAPKTTKRAPQRPFHPRPSITDDISHHTTSHLSPLTSPLSSRPPPLATFIPPPVNRQPLSPSHLQCLCPSRCETQRHLTARPPLFSLLSLCSSSTDSRPPTNKAPVVSLLVDLGLPRRPHPLPPIPPPPPVVLRERIALPPPP